jgi:peptidoglycan/LPS O-acetylase OafA/YrhL
VYVPGIDGLRAIAVVAVMIYHLVPKALPGGFVGVDVFFVISGYVVTGSLLRDRGLSLGRFIAAFYARRFRRIIPALVVCLCVTVLAAVAFIPEAWLSRSMQDTALNAFFGLSNFALVSSDDGYFAPRSEFNPYTHTWSLAVEEQFYLLFPFLIYLWISRSGTASAKAVSALLVSLCVASLLGCAWASRYAPNQAYFMLPSRFWELGAGAGVCLMADSYRRRIVATLGPGALSAIGLLLVALSMAAADRLAFPFPWALPAVLGSALLIVSTTTSSGQGRINRLLGARPMVAVGLLSYSLYLWHWPVYTLARWTVGLDSLPTRTAALAVTGVLAWLSYRWVERPAQQHPWLRRLPPRGAIVGGLGLVAAGWLWAFEIYAHHGLVGLSVVSRQSVDWYPYASRPSPPGAPDTALCKVRGTTTTVDGIEHRAMAPRDCKASGAGAPPRLFVAGDSHASAYDRLLQAVVAETGVTVRRYSKGGCPLVNLIQASSAFGSECRSYNLRLIEQLVSEARPGDIVWLASLRAPRLGDQWAAFAPQDVHERLTSEAAALDRARALAEAQDLVARLSRAGVRVIVDAAKPVYPSPPFRCSDTFNRANPVCAAGISVSRESAERHRGPGLAALASLVAQHPAIFVWDPLPALCTATECAALVGGRPLYFDGDHLSGYGNEVLVPSFISLLQHVMSEQRPTASAR